MANPADLGQGRAESWNELAEGIFRASGKPKNIEYVEMPDNLKNQYQYFTEADMAKFRKTGCPVKFKNIFEGAGEIQAQVIARRLLEGAN